MQFNATDGRYHEALRRLGVVLLMLAEVVDRAAGRCWPIRSLLLWLLSRAAVRAAEFAAGLGALPLPVGMPGAGAGVRAVPYDGRSGHSFLLVQAQSGDGALSWDRGEAAHLAETFRTLAEIFFALARPARHWLRTTRRHLTRDVHRASQTLRGFFPARPPCVDTS